MKAEHTMKLMTANPSASANADNPPDAGQVLALANDVDPCDLALDGVTRIELNFPKFTDGRAFSQAFLLRRRLGYAGELRATGDVLIDQLLQMKRSGFDSAVLRADQNPDFAQRQLQRYPAFYQGDAGSSAPRFTASPSSEVQA
jgi:uncharacterized protein (DUF934 family)